LAIVIVALLIITRVIDIEEAGKAVAKTLCSIVALLAVLCVLKGTLSSLLKTLIGVLKIGLGALALVALVLISAMVAKRLLAGKAPKTSVRRGNSQGDDL
jgi:hypothetical protein